MREAAEPALIDLSTDLLGWPPILRGGDNAK
jgi:hypothetical protein